MRKYLLIAAAALAILGAGASKAAADQTSMNFGACFYNGVPCSTGAQWVVNDDNCAPGACISITNVVSYHTVSYVSWWKPREQAYGNGAFAENGLGSVLCIAYSQGCIETAYFRLPCGGGGFMYSPAYQQFAHNNFGSDNKNNWQRFDIQGPCGASAVSVLGPTKAALAIDRASG